MASKAALAGDPRDMTKVAKLAARPAPADDIVMQVTLLVAMLVGVSGMMFQVKAALWVSAFLLLSAASRMPFQPTASQNYTQMATMSLTMLGWAFFHAYFGPAAKQRNKAVPAQPAPEAAAEQVLMDS